MSVPVLHGVPVEYDICTEWEAIDELEPVPQVTLAISVLKWKSIFPQIGT